MRREYLPEAGVMFVQLQSVPVVQEVGHDVLVIVVMSPHRLHGEVKHRQVNHVRPDHVHPLEAF